MRIEPYLFFEGRCDEAIEFYRQAIGADIKGLMRYKESPVQEGIQPGLEDKVMHASLRVGDNTIFLSDGHAKGQPNFQSFALTLTAANPAEAGRYFSALAEGGKIVMPLTKTFFSPSFGMLADRFGVMWMVIVMQ